MAEAETSTAGERRGANGQIAPLRETEAALVTEASPQSLKIWTRPSVDHFEDMNLRQFSRYSLLRHPSVLHDSVLGPTSMKHPSWEGSESSSNLCLPLVISVVISLIISLAVGLAVGFSIYGDGNVAWGIGSGAIVLTGAFLVFFVNLVTYMACYGQGLHNPPMPDCVDRGGFLRNIRANVVCRYFMTCCFNGKIHCVDCIMNKEAGDALKRIQEMNNGQGPPPNGVCWLGDSEFTFWHHLARDMKGFHDNHINAGFGGSRIEDIQQNVRRLCLDWEPSTVIIHASGNDRDFDQGVTAKEVVEKLLTLFQTIEAHPSITRIGYMLSSRRPIYSDAKWDFLVRVHSLTLEAISKSPRLNGIVKVLDLRGNVWPLDHFVEVDRVHLNEMGHAKKSEVLLPLMLAVWPKEVPV